MPNIREIPSVTDVPRHPDANYEQEAYGDALRTAALLFDPIEPMVGSEFRRGIVNFLADAYAVSELETGLRMLQVEADLTHAIEVVWAKPEAPANRRLEFRAHVAITVPEPTTDREAEQLIDGYLDHAREACEGDRNLSIELDEGSPDEVES
jgi:hypothetical protein